MIPKSNLSNQQIEAIVQPSKTYKIDTKNNSVAVIINGLDAVKQASDLIMSTERYKYSVYSWLYGVELDSLIGKEYDYVSVEIKRRIKEALMQDDRIIDVINFRFSSQEDGLLVECDVISIFGKFNINKAVKI